MSHSIPATDLTQRPPRALRQRLGGDVILPRLLDKGRAALAGFAEYIGQRSTTREDIRPWFDALALDDYSSFRGKP